MRLRRNSFALVTLIDGTVLRGRVVWSWRWRVVRLVGAYAVTRQGKVDAAGPVLIPHRSIVVAQEVTENG